MHYRIDDFLEHSLEKAGSLLGKKVILRLDINVPLGDNGRVDPGEDWRILRSLPTIEYLQSRGASIVILAHTGEDSLKPMFEYLSQHMTLGFAYLDEHLASRVADLAQGAVLLVENVRCFEDEEMDRIDFLLPLIQVCDLFVNDAFSVSHRRHASIHAITKELPSYFGLQFIKEVSTLATLVDPQDKKLCLVLGGAKFDTKLRLLEKMLPKIHFALIGGAAANVFLKARGFNVGKSYCDESVDVRSMLENEKIILPIDCIDQEGDIISIDAVRDEDMILDIGPETEALFSSIIHDVDIVLWNGPLGKYEDGYIAGSLAVAQAMQDAPALSIVGGGDTLASFSEEVYDFDFVSTGGGALLDFLIDGTLPGIEAIVQKKETA